MSADRNIVTRGTHSWCFSAVKFAWSIASPVHWQMQWGRVRLGGRSYRYQLRPRLKLMMTMADVQNFNINLDYVELHFSSYTYLSCSLCRLLPVYILFIREAVGGSASPYKHVNVRDVISMKARCAHAGLCSIKCRTSSRSSFIGSLDLSSLCPSWSWQLTWQRQ